MAKKLTKEKLVEEITRIVVDQLGVDEEEVTLDASFVYDLGCDSLDVVELVMAFEEEFKIEIPDDDTEKMIHVRDVIEYLEPKVCG